MNKLGGDCSALGRKPDGRPRRKWDDNIKMNL